MPIEPLQFLKMNFIDKLVAFCVSIWTEQSFLSKPVQSKLFPSEKYKFRNWVQLLREFMAVVEEQKESSSFPQPKVSSLFSSLLLLTEYVTVQS